jgi:hypothetical protein
MSPKRNHGRSGAVHNQLLSPTPKDGTPRGDREDAPLIAELERSVDPLVVARTAARLAAQRYARFPCDEGAKTLHAALETWRKMENDALELAAKRGTLIEREVALQSLGELCANFIRALERHATRFSSQHEMWIFDEKHRALTPEERARAVYEWSMKQTRSARIEEAEKYERMLDETLAERDGGAPR